ncbi:MAG: aspartate carbamoyltransferase regulatory subunit [DPANN group archaeon]|nr:aspartate carbamoyltransferase regulatory subunit [DPANN group archaeon]
MSQTGQMKEYKVSAIKNGTVIDHIPAGSAFKVAELLDLSHTKGTISVATNLKSRMLRKKGIIKIGNKELTENETNRVALFAPLATINIIEDYAVKEKRKVSLPTELHHLVKCVNPNCITNKEDVLTCFRVVRKDPLELRCHYCERVMGQDDLRLL